MSIRSTDARVVLGATPGQTNAGVSMVWKTCLVKFSSIHGSISPIHSALKPSPEVDTKCFQNCRRGLWLLIGVSRGSMGRQCRQSLPLRPAATWIPPPSLECWTRATIKQPASIQAGINPGQRMPTPNPGPLACRGCQVKSSGIPVSNRKQELAVHWRRLKERQQRSINFSHKGTWRDE